MTQNKIAIVASQFYPQISEALIENTVSETLNLVLIKIYWISSMFRAFEIPVTVAKLAQTRQYAGIVTMAV